MKRRLHGFTLVELLVVISIIGMLVGLLLPAVNMAREAGRRVTCENNLKQLSTAIGGHVTTLGFYPSGGLGIGVAGDPNIGPGAKQPGGWIYQILPYMDGAAMHDWGKGNTSLTASCSTARVQTPLPYLYCPSRRAGQAYANGNASGTSATVSGRTDYAANGGNFYLQNGLASGFNGIVGFGSQVRDAMITDTKETTYLVGEKYMAPENYLSGSDPGDLGSAMSGDDVSLTRWGSTTWLPSMDRQSFNNPPANPTYIFGSAHGAGWHAAFCDGHVQLIGWGLDPTTHQTMASRNGVKKLGYPVVDPTLIPH